MLWSVVLPSTGHLYFLNCMEKAHLMQIFHVSCQFLQQPLLLLELPHNKQLVLMLLLPPLLQLPSLINNNCYYSCWHCNHCHHSGHILTLSVMSAWASMCVACTHTSMFACVVFRYDKGRGDVLGAARLPDASARQLSCWALRDHDVLLEEQAWRQAHLWLHAECPGWLLHRHRGTIPAATIETDTSNQYRHLIFTPDYIWGHFSYVFYFL